MCVILNEQQVFVKSNEVTIGANGSDRCGRGCGPQGAVQGGRAAGGDRPVVAPGAHPGRAVADRGGPAGRDLQVDVVAARGGERGSARGEPVGARGGRGAAGRPAGGAAGGRGAGGARRGGGGGVVRGGPRP